MIWGTLGGGPLNPIYKIKHIQPNMLNQIHQILLTKPNSQKKKFYQRKSTKPNLLYQIDQMKFIEPNLVLN